jgi:type IV pilus assembly protein PilY1
MFILDDSGSMDWDYSPDYVDDVQGSGSTPNTTAACFDGGDTGPTGTTFSQDFDDSSGTITGRADHCIAGDPPFMSPDFNKQYYNPAIWYRPGVNADGTDKTSMTSANTSAWTAVPTDPYGEQQDDQRGVSKTTENLVANYPDRAWCKSTGDAATDTTNCRVNSAYTYPNWEYNRGFDNTNGYGNNYGNVKFRYGSPYYYRMQTAQWCSTPTLDAGTCVSGSTVNPNTHIYIAPEFCTDAELVNCAAGAALTPAHTFSGPRWCSDQTTLLTCQRKKVGNFRWPKHLGVTQVRAVNVGPFAATGTITVTQSGAGEQVLDIKVGGVTIIAGAITATGSSTSALATQIANAITAHTSSPDYTATASGSTVTVRAVTVGDSENGKTLLVTTTQTGTTAATATIDVDSSGSNSDVYLDGIQVLHPTTGVLTNLMSPSCSGSYGNNVFATGGGTYGNRLEADTGTNSSSERNSLAAGIEDCIDEHTGTTGFSASRSGDVVTIRAPVSLGNLMNGRSLTIVKGGSNGSYDTTNFTGGVSTGAVVSTSGSLAGGADVTTGNLPVRLGVGQFSRVNIVSSNDTYSKAASRFDCAGATCSYAEEMTNFANWYAYYRTRMQMMK